MATARRGHLGETQVQCEDRSDFNRQAEQIVRGLGPQALRDNRRLRQQVVEQLPEVGVGVDSLLVDRPRRRIIRSQEGA